MKKFMKGCAIAALILIVLGTGLGVFASVVKGREFMNDFTGKLFGERLADMARGLGFQVKDTFEDATENLPDVEEWEESIGFEEYDIHDAMNHDSSYPIEEGEGFYRFAGEDIRKVSAEVGGCVLTVAASPDKDYQVMVENGGRIQVYEKEGKLVIHGLRKAREEGKRCEITLLIPEDAALEEADIELGAGLVEIESILAEEIDLEVGAGKIVAGALKTNKLEVSVGAGEVTLQNMETDVFSAEVGMGHFEGSGSVAGKIEAECSMGGLELKLAEAKEYYDYELECKAGTIELAGESYSGLAQEKRIDHRAGRRAELECSMGTIRMEFEQ